MQILRMAVVAALVASVVPLTPASGAPAERYIVVLDDSAAPGRVANRHADRFGADVRFVYRHSIKGYAARIPADKLDDVAADDVVRYVAEDHPVHTTAQTLPTGVDRVDGELSSTVAGDGTGSVDVDVAVLDTGIDRRHADLDVRGGVNCASGGDFSDRNGHGTHVSGTIGARDDGSGVVGVAPGARLWAVRVLGASGSGSWASIICGVDWVTANASTIEVANMSLGGPGTEPSDAGCSTRNALHDAICRSVAAGVTYVVAAGNSASDAKNFVPAAFDEVITVSALADFDGLSGGAGDATCRSDQDDTFADFSNYGADIDMIAPGVCILSTWKNGGYDTISGTSMASPHVAGAAALYKAHNLSASPAAVGSALQAAGTLDWNNSDDRDATKERLLNVDPL